VEIVQDYNLERTGTCSFSVLMVRNWKHNSPRMGSANCVGSNVCYLDRKAELPFLFHELGYRVNQGDYLVFMAFGGSQREPRSKVMARIYHECQE